MNSMKIEIKKFFRNNIKKLIILTLLIGTILAIVTFFIDSDLTEQEDTDVTQEKIEPTIAYFQFYVEKEDGNPLNSLAIIQEYFSREVVMQEMSAQTSTPLENILLGDEQYLEQKDINDLNNTDTTENEISNKNDFIAIEMYKGQYSNLFTLTVKSKDSEKNMEITEYYYDLVANDEVSIFNDKNVYIFSEPKINDSLLVIDETVEIDANIEESTSIINILGAYLLAFIMVLSFLVLKTLFSQKLTYSFSYLWNETDLFLVHDSSAENHDEVKQFINIPQSNKKVILSENEISKNVMDILQIDFTENISNQKEVYHSVTEIKLDDLFEDIIIVIHAGETTRDWYRHQQQLLSISNVNSVKIIQLNN